MALIRKKPSFSKNKLSLRFRPGVTLVEIITSTAIIGVLALMLGSIYLASFKLFNAETTQIDLQINAILAIDDLQDTLRVAVSVQNCVVEPCKADPLPSGLTPVIVGENKISLTYEPLNSDNKPMIESLPRETYCQEYPPWIVGDPIIPFWDHIWYELEGTNLVKTTLTYSVNYMLETTTGPCRSTRLSPNCSGIQDYEEACVNKKIIVKNVSDLHFEYFDEFNPLPIDVSTSEPDPTCVRSVEVSITLSKDTIYAGSRKVYATQTEKINLVNFVGTCLIYIDE